MHHTVVYRGSVPAGSSDVKLTLIQGAGDVSDGSGNYFPPQDLTLLYGLSFGSDIYEARIVTPTLRELSPHYLRPVNVSSTIGSNAAFVDESDFALKLKAREGIEVQVANSGAAANTATVILGLLVRPIDPPRGERRRVKLTGSTTLTANVWTNVGLTQANTLPAGRYAVVGMQAFGTTLYACRLRFPDSAWAPGVPCVQSVSQRPPDTMRQHDWGVFGYFDQSAVPTLECLASAGDTSQTLFLDLVRL